MKYFLVLMIGFGLGLVPLLVVGNSTLVEFSVEKKCKAFWKSTDPDEIHELAIELARHGSGIQQLSMVFGMYPETTTAEHKIAVVEALENSKFFQSLLSTFPEGATDTDSSSAVKMKCLDVLNIGFQRQFLLSLNMIIRRLPDEVDQEVLDEKITLLCHYLILDEEQIREFHERNGVEVIIQFFNNRYKDLLLPEVMMPYRIERVNVNDELQDESESDMYHPEVEEI